MRWALTTTMVFAGAALGEEPWRAVSEDHGVVVEVQTVPGSAYENIRVTCDTTASPHAFIHALWGAASDTSTSPAVVRRDVLVDEAQERRYHDVVHAPPASDRDYVMHTVWGEDGATGEVAMRFGTVEDPREPVSPELVRFSKVAGSISATPRPDGGSTLRYVIFSDLGGSLPAWIAIIPERNAAKAYLLEIRRRAEQAPR